MSFFSSFIIDCMVLSNFISSFLPSTWMASWSLVLYFYSCLISTSYTWVSCLPSISLWSSIFTSFWISLAHVFISPFIVLDDVVDSSLGIWDSLASLSFTFYFTIMINSVRVVEYTCLWWSLVSLPLVSFIPYIL